MKRFIYDNKTVISPFRSNKNGRIVVFIATKRTYCSLQWYKKTLWTHYFSFFPLFVGFLVEFICQTSEKTKFESKMQKMKKLNFSKFGLVTLLNSINNIICYICYSILYIYIVFILMCILCVTYNGWYTWNGFEKTDLLFWFYI